MNERHPHGIVNKEGNDIVDHEGNIRHPHDLGHFGDFDEEGQEPAREYSFDELPVGDQRRIDEILNHSPHRDEHEDMSTVSDVMETAPELEQPLPARKAAGEILRRIQASADERDRPYDELGGRLHEERTKKTAKELLETAVAGAKAWMRDVQDMLRYAIPDLEPESVDQMNREDRELLALHFQGLWDRIPAAERMIGWGSWGNGFLTERYGKGGTPEEMIAYLERLEALDEYFQLNEVARKLQQIAYGGYRSKKERDAKYRRDRTKYGDIQVTQDDNGKYYVKRISRKAVA